VLLLAYELFLLLIFLRNDIFFSKPKEILSFNLAWLFAGEKGEKNERISKKEE
jgi:hypothetical protein